MTAFTYQVGLDEYVSDYMAMERDADDGRLSPNRAIAAAYVEAWGDPSLTDEQYKAEVDSLTPQVAYYTERGD